MPIRAFAARIAVSVVAAFISAGGPPRQPAPYLTGRVIDGDTGRPVARAIVQLSGRHALSVETDVEGRYQSGTLPPGMYALTVTREGYLPSVALYAGRVPLRLRVGDGPSVVRKDWLLMRAARIAGHVRTEGGAPIEGVTVIAARRLRDVDGWPQFDIRGTGTTRADGQFQISNLARGPYVVAYRLPAGGRWFYSPGIIDPRQATQIEAVSGAASSSIDLTGSTAPPADLPVATLSPAGGPSPNTAVELTAWNPFPSMSRRDTIVAVTDSSGRGVLPGVPVGRHQLQARAPGSLRSPAAARASSPVEIVNRLAAGIDVRLQQTVSACLLTRWESDGATQEDMRSTPMVRASTRDAALVAESLDEQAPLGSIIRLEGLLPGSLLHVSPVMKDGPWSLTRFSPWKPAPRGLVPIDAAAAGCTAAYFRRTSELIAGRVGLGNLEWVPELEVIATPVNASSAPVAVSSMMDDGSFRLSGIALGLQYEVIAVPAGMSVDMIPSGLRRVITAKGGDVITVPLSLPFAR